MEKANKPEYDDPALGSSNNSRPNLTLFVAVGALAVAVIVFASSGDSIRKFLQGDNVDIYPTPTVIVCTSIQPTDNINDFVIPSGITEEDRRIRESVKKVYRDNSVFNLDGAEVLRYLETGDTKGFVSFQVLADAAGQPAFVLITNEENGFTQQETLFVRRAIARLNEIDKTLLRKLVDEFGLGFVCGDIYNGEFFRNYSGYAGSYTWSPGGGVVLLNQAYITNDSPRGDEYVAFKILGDVIMESRALYTSRVEYTKDGNYTSAPDRLNVKIGIDKGEFLKRYLLNWAKDELITDFEYATGRNACRATIFYYSR